MARAHDSGNQQSPPRRVGLALGGGAAWGFAHIGILKVLHAAHVPIHAIAGTSIGALTGGLYAAGVAPVEMEHLITRDRLKTLAKVFVPSFPHGGLVNGARVAEFVRSLVGERRIEDLPVPFAAVATDFRTGEEVVLREGLLCEALRASACVPGLFNAPWLNGRLLCDGGLVNPVPADTCRALGADAVIAVNVIPRIALSRDETRIQPPEGPLPETHTIEAVWNSILETIDRRGDFGRRLADWLRPSPRPAKPPAFGTVEAIIQASVITSGWVIEYRKTALHADLILQPETQAFSASDFDKGRHLVPLGTACAEANLQAILALARRR